jgi:hypothetical protein
MVGQVLGNMLKVLGRKAALKEIFNFLITIHIKTN